MTDAARDNPESATPEVDKWALLRMMTRGREDLGLSNRELGVLQALLSFVPGDTLGGTAQMIVFASNKTLCERLNGMACSTMRRHLARLVEMGLLARCDSPNGKRYSRRSTAGTVAYGLDLSPLAARLAEFALADQRATERKDRIRHLRETISLMRRDITAIAEADPSCRDEAEDQLILSARLLRRKLSVADLESMAEALHSIIARFRAQIPSAPVRSEPQDQPCETDEPSTSPIQNEHHQQSSKKDIFESEQAVSQETRQALTGHESQASGLSLSLILTACPEARSFATEPPRSLRAFADLLEALRPGMGIDDPTWRDAVQAMGREQACVALAAMLERLDTIRSPGAYLRNLALRARNGAFSVAPMIMALVNDRRRAA